MTKCSECGKPMTVDKNAVVRYTLGGLPHVELHGVQVSKCGSCGNQDVGIPRLAQLHRVLAHTFVTQSRMLAPAEIKYLRKHMGLSGEDFAKRMGVTRETVSRWETGATPMGAVADRLLRLLVVSHEPTESYAVDNMLQSLTDRRAPERLASVAVQMKKEGWEQAVAA